MNMKKIPLYVIPNLNNIGSKQVTVPQLFPYTDMSLSLYIHFPFCTSKCPFCPIKTMKYGYTYALDYIKSLKKELTNFFDKNKGCKINCIHFGGGTPSLMSVTEFNDILCLIGRYVNINDSEILIEVHPNYINDDLLSYLSGYKNCTINLGVQSFSDLILLNMKRNYTNIEILRCVDFIRRSKCSIGIDYICDWPNANINSLITDLKFIESIHPEHISQYPLYLQSNIKFLDYEVSNNLKQKIELNSLCNQKILELGYTRYSVFHYENGCQITHKYGRAQLGGGKWIGFGANAYSYLGDCMYVNSDVNNYTKGEYKYEIYKLTSTDCFLWEMMYMIRKNNLTKNAILKKYGIRISGILNAIIDKLLEYNYIESNQVITLTWNGIINLDRVEKIITSIAIQNNFSYED